MNTSPPALPTSFRPVRFHTMVKPSGAQCNLDCSYCFYLHKEQLLHQPQQPRMNEEVLRAHIQQQFDARSQDQVVFSWQGGEPTLMGLDFFHDVVRIQQELAPEGVAVHNDLQTNGILIDDKWAAFLAEHRFLVGLSIDGPAALHDLYRRTKGNTPTSERVLRAAELLRSHGVAFHALCVVNNANARRPIDVYRFLRDQVRPRMIQFIPCVEPLQFTRCAPGSDIGSASDSNPPEVTSWSVSAPDWGYFLARIWQEWIRKDIGKVFVDQFENVVSQMFGYGAQRCVTSRHCGRALALEHNGDLYSCDHYVYPEYRLGNVLQEHEGVLAQSPAQTAFGQAKESTLTSDCRNCTYLELCWGDCPKNRFISSPKGEAGHSYLCAGLRQFYAKATADKTVLANRLGLTPP